MTNTMPPTTLALPDRPAGRRVLILLAAMFALPFVIGTLLFWSGWRPPAFSNHGELLQPPRPLPESGLTDAAGRPLSTAELRGNKWLLLLPAAGICAEDCRQRLRQMEQVHVALGKEQTRVRRVFLDTGADHPIPVGLQHDFPGLVVAKVAGSGPKSRWDDALAGSDNGILVVDPFGNVMMRYGETTNMATTMRGVLKDLERLLKYSWIR
jgi:hypothetical protein